MLFSHDLYLRLPVVLIFGLIGYVSASRFPSLRNQYGWFLILGALVLFGLVSRDPWPVTVSGMTVPLKTLLSGALIGTLAGFVLHRRITK